MLKGILADDIKSRVSGTRLLATKKTRALARARALLAADEAATPADGLNTGKLTRLLLWNAELILASYREKNSLGRGKKARPRSEWRGLQEKLGAFAGDFCYSIYRQGRENTAGAV
jgi:hypothetical protein